MNLHHSHNEPDWAAVPLAHRTSWQRLAAATNGVVTPGNVISASGFVLVVSGSAALLLHHMVLALWCIVVGRCADLADGFVADRTGTKSPLGEGVDAVFDKLGVLCVLIAVGPSHVLDWWMLLLVFVQNGITAFVAYRAHQRHVHIQPSALGKIGTGGMWLGLFGCLLAAAYNRSWLWPSYVVLFVALALNGLATVQYARPLRRTHA
jgi:phosphatidylglycerophosphate synthase